MKNLRICILTVLVLAAVLSGCAFSEMGNSRRMDAVPMAVKVAEVTAGGAASQDTPADIAPTKKTAAKKIKRKAALQIALADAELTRDQVEDVDIELERSFRAAWYEIDFENGFTEYEYKIDAYTGEILSANTEM